MSEAAFMKALREFQKEPDNKRCADCKELLDDDDEHMSCACGKTKVHKYRMCIKPVCQMCGQ